MRTCSTGDCVQMDVCMRACMLLPCVNVNDHATLVPTSIGKHKVVHFFNESTNQSLKNVQSFSQ